MDVSVDVHSAARKSEIPPSRTMRKENHSSIPRLTRSSSLRLPRERPSSLGVAALNSHSKCKHLCRATSETPDADDSLSTKSYGSCASFMSCEIGVGTGQDRNLTNCHSQNKKYVLHCQREIQTDKRYLTPTQRKDREIRQLKAALIRTSRTCEEKGVEVERLKSEVDRLRFSNSQSCTTLSQPSESPVADFRESESAEAIGIVKEKFLVSDHCGQFLKSNETRLEDSGILDDLVEANVKCNLDPKNDFNSKSFLFNDTEDSLGYSCEKTIIEENEDGSSFAAGSFTSLQNKETQTVNKSSSPFNCSQERKIFDSLSTKWPDEDLHKRESCRCFRNRSKLENSPFSHFEEDNISLDVGRLSTEDFQEMKEKYNTKIENLLLKLSEQNLRYLEIRNGYDKALERIRQLDSQVAELRRDMAAQEEWHSQMYLKMYRKGQEAAKFEHADEVLEFAHRAPKRVSVPELLQQLHQTEHELEETKQMYRCELYRQASYVGGADRQAEYTLKFLKDAVYYYLTEKDNKGHLQAIESILGFSDSERISVAKSQRQKKI